MACRASTSRAAPVRTTAARTFTTCLQVVKRSRSRSESRTPIRAPNANAFTEPWKETLRAECLDWVLILGPRHLDRILRIYVQHYNRRRPHRGLELQVPESLAPVEEVDG